MDFLSDDSDSEVKGFQINEKYAKRFEHNKQREELHRLQEKYSNGSESDSSTDDEVEDEDGELITPQIDAQIMKTIKLIQDKNPIIYDKEAKLIDDQLVERARQKLEAKTMEKGMSLREYQAKQLLFPKADTKTFTEEQHDAKNEFKAAIGSLEEDEEEEDLFTVRKEEADQDYSKFILDQMYHDEPTKDWNELQKKLDTDQQFLMNYVLNKGWTDKDAGKIPTYSQITEHTLHDTTDEEDDERMDEFEYKHNFRFEEEDSQFVVTHAREIPGVIRRKDDKRGQQRQAAEERKKEEKRQKQEEIKRLKNLKKQQLAEKLKQIQQMAGGDFGLDEEDLEKEFDPDEYDQKMKSTFDEEYYAKIVCFL
jgi:protein KRI1